MASTVESFLKLKPKKLKRKTVTIELQGQDFEFEIQELDPELLSEIQMANAVAIPSSVAGGPSTEGANPVKLSLDVCLQAIVSPNLKSIELQDHFGVTTDRDLLYEMFKGDIQSLTNLFEEVINLTSESTSKETRGVDKETLQKAKN